MFDIVSPRDFTFTTPSIFYKNVFGSKPLSRFLITPVYSPIWDYKSLSIFINEIIEYEPASIKPIRKVTSVHDKFYEFKFTHINCGNDYEIVVHIFYEKNFSITVSISRNIIKTKGWVEIEERKNVLYSFQYSIPVLSVGSDTILHDKSLAFINKYDFNNCFYFFAKNLTNNIIPKNRFTSFLFEFSEIFLNRHYFNSVFNFKQLKLKNQGYLRLIVTDKAIPKLSKIDEKSYVLCSHYISPFAQSILNLNNFLDGIQLDCTFKVI